MKKIVFLLSAMLLTIGLQAQNTIVGDWMTVDDKTGDNYSIVTIYQESDGLYYGKISKMLMGPQDYT